MLDVDHEQYKEAPAEGVYVYGMYLEGCGWDAGRRQLCESQPKVRGAPLTRGLTVAGSTQSSPVLACWV